jgi:UDP-galactose transporter B1
MITLSQRKKKSKTNATTIATIPRSGGRTNAEGVRLLVSVGGIYVTYLYYGTLQEEVYTDAEFHYVWFVQLIETVANMITAYIGSRSYQAYTKRKDKHTNSNEKCTDENANDKNRVSHHLFMVSGASQVFSKALTSLSLNNGLSFPIATLAKSGKMAPVMLGQLFLGNSNYTGREYAQVICIIMGTGILGLSKSKNKNSSMNTSSPLGIFFIICSLFMDGITGGFQKRIKEDAEVSGKNIKGFDFMFFTNLYMMVVAFTVAMLNNDLILGFRYCMDHPHLLSLICRFCTCSAMGQSFIFFTISSFDPLVCSTVTTTRKIFSVLLSIWYNGHILNHRGWCGIMLAFVGIACELRHKICNARMKEIKPLIANENV